MNKKAIWVASGVGLLLLLISRRSEAAEVAMAVGEKATDLLNFVLGKKDKQATWVKAFATVAAPICERYGVPLQICLAQAAVESAWGKAAPGGNYFGIKGKGPAGSVVTATKEEYTPGQMTTIKDSFAAYENVAQSIEGWCKFVTAPRYIPPQGSDVGARLLWIWARGYATASKYPTAVQSVSKSIAARIGPQFAIKLSDAQLDLAKKLGNMKPLERQTAALEIAKAGQWPV